MEQQQDFATIPGLLQEPLDLFHDDVFAGLDEPASGPWPHHSLVEPAPLLLPQQHCAGMQDSHFPAIDCNLLDEQHWHAAEAAAAAGVQHGGHSSSGAAQGPGPDAPSLVTACGVAPSPMQHLDASCHVAAAAAEQGAGEPGSSSQHGGMLQLSEHESGVAVLPPPQLEEPCVHAPAPSWGQGSASSSARSAQDQAAGVGGDGAADDVTGTAEAVAVPAAPCGADAVGTAGSDAPSGSSADAAAASVGGSLHAGDGSDPGSPSAPTTAPSADPSTAAVVAPADPVGETPSSGSSLPDIDDVPEEQAGLQDEQQGQQQEGEQQADMQLQQEACAEQPPSSQEQPEEPAPAPGVTPLACSAGSLGAPAAGAEEGCQAGATEAGPPCSHGCSAAATAASAAAATAAAADAGCSGSSEHAYTEQQRSVHADDDFASPCSSWHSCVTASSNQASSMSSKRGFFLPTAAPGDAADASGGAAAVLPGGSTARQPLSCRAAEPQQPPSSSGVSSPAMVSSLHLALQQQQTQSQHSEQMAASAVSDDPLTAGLALSVSSLAAGIAAREDHTVAPAATAAASVADASSAEPGACTSGSQPIAMQQRLLPQQEDLWQDVSPPSFSSSPGLLVSAAAARAEAASQQHQEQQAQQGQQQEAAAGSEAADADAEAAAAQQEGGDAVDDDVGHGCFYAAGTGLSMSPEQGFLAQHLGALHRGPGLQHQQQHLGNSSYVLRQSELVDLSLSTSLHPSQMQHAAQQQVHPGWLTAHQQLPPAAAQAVERAVVALNDSYYGQGRSSPSEVFGSAAAAGGAAAGPASRSSSGATAIRRAGAGQQWNRAHTQPQQDQQARHRLPSQAAAGGPGGPFGWPGAAVLGDWFSSTVQQPLAAVASRAAVGVGQRLGMAQHHSSQQQLHGSGRQHSGGTWTAGAAGGGSGAGAHGGLPPGSSGSGSGVSRLAAADGAPAAGDHLSGDCLEEGLDDAVLVEKTSDLPQSLQEQEDEAFRGLLFLGGRDSQGRPVVIVNTDAIPAGHNSAPRDAALAYLLKRLSPVVTRGPYVLVVVALHHGPQFRLLPGVWCVRAYQSLPRAFRKHVKHVILLQPSMLVKAAVTLLYPFVSSKAHAKVKQVQRLLDIDAATSGEVQVPHLGEAFLTTIHHINSSRAHQEDSTAQG